MNDYQPITCAQHEQLEFSVLRKIPLQIHYADALGETHETVLPLDVTTRDRAEWLTFRKASGEVMQIRLDQIIAFSERRNKAEIP